MRKLLPAIIALTLILILLGCSMGQDAVGAIRSGNTSDAYELYRHANENEQAEVEDAVRSLIETTVEDYNNGNTTYSDATRIMDSVADSSIVNYSEVASANILLDELRGSKEAFDSAQQYMSSGNYYSAMLYYSMVSERDTNYERAQEGYKRARTSYILDVRNQAESAANQNDYGTAIMILSTADYNLGGDQELETLIMRYETDRDNQIVKSTITLADSYMASGDYASAYRALSDAMYEYSDHVELVSAFSSCEQKYIEDALKRAEAAIAANNDYDAAISIISLAQADMPNNSKLQSKKEDYAAKKEIAQAERYMTSGEYSTAYHILSAAIVSYPNRSDILSAYNSCAQKYIQNAISQAEAAFSANGDYDKAISIIALVQVDFPEDAQLQSAYDKYVSYRPVELKDLDSVYEVGGEIWHKNDSIKDNLGNQYSDYYRLTTGSSSKSSAFRINGKYDMLSGRLFKRYEDRNYDTGYVEIYGDGKLLFASGNLGLGAEPLDFTVSVSGVVELKFVWKGGSGFYGDTLRMTNVWLKKGTGYSTNTSASKPTTGTGITSSTQTTQIAQSAQSTITNNTSSQTTTETRTEQYITTGDFYLKSASNGKYLGCGEVKKNTTGYSGYYIQFVDSTGSAICFSPSLVSGNTVLLRAKNINTTYLDAWYSKVDGKAADLWTRGSDAEQQWVLEKQSDGTYLVYLAGVSNRYLTNETAVDGDSVSVRVRNNSSTQKWYVVGA